MPEDDDIGLGTIKKLDDEITRIQRSTKTTIGFFSSAHNFMRMKFPWYYAWHTKSKVSYFHIGALAVYIFIVSFISVHLLTSVNLVGKSLAADTSPLSGQAVVVNTGVNLNFSDYQSNVVINNITKVFSGYAWSDDLGWVAFGTVDNPDGPVSFDNITGLVSGKAKFVNTGDVIDFNSSPYGSNVSISQSGVFSGYAWSSDIGLINFDGVTTEGIIFAPTLTTSSPTNVSAVSSTLNGAIVNTGGENSTERGFDYYQSSDCSGVVSNVYELGDFGVGEFSLGIVGLSPSTQYSYKAYSTNTGSSGYGECTNFYTLAYTPGSPTVSAASTTTVNIIIDTNENLISTEYAIFNETLGKFVQADGTVGDSAVWQTYANWGGASGIDNIDLSVGSQYSYKVKARSNGNETGYSSSGLIYTLSNIPGTSIITPVSSSSTKIIIDTNGNYSSVLYSIFNVTLSKFVQADGTVGDSAVWRTYANWGESSGIVNTGLIKDTNYVYKVKAKNGDGVESAYSSEVDVTTLNVYDVTISKNGTGNGSFDKSSPVSLDTGGSVSIKATTASSSIFNSWTGCDVVVDDVCSINSIQEDKVVTATFTLKTFTITPVYSMGGTITPNEIQTVNYGQEKTFEIKANTGYIISDVLVDNISQGARTDYTFTGVSENHIIQPVFALAPDEPDKYTVTVYKSGKGSGTTSITSVTVDSGDSVEIIASASESSVFKSWGGSISSTSPVINIKNITSNKNLVAVFDLKSFTVTAAAGTGGTIEPKGETTVVWGDDLTYKLIPDEGYYLDIISVDGENIEVVDEYTLKDIKADHIIIASFVILEETVSAGDETFIEPEDKKITLSKMVDTVAKVTVSAAKKTSQPISATVAVAAMASAAAAPIASASTMFSFPEYLRNSFYMIGALFGRKKKKWGRVIEIGSGLPIGQVRVSLIRLPDSQNTTERVVAVTYTNSDGTYAFVAEAGLYRISVEKQMYKMSDVGGYYNSNKSIKISNDKEALVIEDIAMSMKDVDIRKKVKFLSKMAVFEKISSYLTIILLSAGTFTSGVSVASGSGGIATKIILILYIPLWFLAINSMRKTSPFGKVLDDSNKSAVSLALVRVIDSKNGKLVRTAVTNESGKFQALVNKGKYKVFAIKPGYTQHEPTVVHNEDTMKTIKKTIALKKHNA